MCQLINQVGVLVNSKSLNKSYTKSKCHLGNLINIGFQPHHFKIGDYGPVKCKNCPIRRPLSQWFDTFVEFIVLYTLVKEEATGTHYWLVTATLTSTCLMTNTVYRWLSILLPT